MPDFAVQRFNMVESQVRPNDVTDPRILAALGEVPRERFVPAGKQGIAYQDAPIELVKGRFLLEPRTFAKLLTLIAPDAADKVLDIGCATGYSTAVLGKLAASVIGIEQDADLVRMACDSVPAVGIRNATIIQGLLVGGCKDHAPFDAILINGAVEKVPDAILSQLKEGGRLATVIRAGEVGRGRLYLRENGRIGYRDTFDSPAPLLAGFREEVGFVF